jgi:hypothetical protein
MRRFLTAIVFATAAMALVAAAFWYLGGPPVGAQLAAYRVGQAKSFASAKHEIASIERQSNHEAALRELVSGWRTGNQVFDFYLAGYLTDRQSSEDLRRLFSLELSWRPELLADWAHYWSWRTKQSPAEEIASVADYLDALSPVDPPRRLTWREVLDLQSALSLTSHADLALRLGPDNWIERYRGWRTIAPDFAQVRRADKPFADWQGTVPAVPDEN